MILRLLEMLRIIELVWLESFRGEVHLTVKRKSPFGKYWAYVYPITSVGHVILNADGSCSGKSIYIERWMPYRKGKTK